MLEWIGTYLGGPLEFLASPVFRACFGSLLAAVLTWVLLPKFWPRMPQDHGRAWAVEGVKSKGKPTGTGFIFILIAVGVSLLVLPLTPVFVAILGCMVLAMLSGYLDDASEKPWHEYKKAALDAGIVVLAALAMCRWAGVEWWFPFVRTCVTVHPIVFLIVACPLLWFAINATNCTDGVDNLAGSLCALAFMYLGALLMMVVGQPSGSRLFMIPHDAAGADWAVLAFTMIGALGGYLWYNANPSAILMGDAGSRPLGLLLGVLVLATRNPFVILAVAGMILVGGGTGLFKVAFKRFFNIEFLWNIRFPLHDHMKQNLHWSNPQVLVRFMILQSLMTPILLVIFLWIR